MTRDDLVRLSVLDSISDDFENVDQVILSHVAKIGRKCGLKIERPEVVKTLADLVKDGLAKAYILPGPKPDPFSGELEGMPPLDEINEVGTYFYITEKGMALHLADDDPWPLDDDGNLKPDWRLTAEG